MPNGNPNILILWGDHIGQSNLSRYSQSYPSPGQEYSHVSDAGDLVGLRHDNWKGAFKVLRIPKGFNLLTDPCERADITSNTYWDWMFDHIFLIVPAQAYVADFLKTIVDCPTREKVTSFSLDWVMGKIEQVASGRA